MLCQIDIAHSTGPEQSRNAIPGEQLTLPERHSRMIREPQSARGSLDTGAALTSSLTPQPLVLAVGRSGSEVVRAPVSRASLNSLGVQRNTKFGAAGQKRGGSTPLHCLPLPRHLTSVRARR